jgi:DNA polymerase III sliding clamp (beta) subunit (PCNA family)
MTTTTANTLTIGQAQLKHGIAGVLHAIDCESSRYALAGVRVIIERGQITFVATDGRRLAYRRIELDHDCEPMEFTIPAKQARELAKMYSTGTCTVTMLDTIYYGKDDFIVVNWTNGRRVAKQTKFKPLDGRFPNWKAIVDENQSNQWKGELSGPADLLLPFFVIDRKIDLRVNGKAQIYSTPTTIRGSVTRRANEKTISHDGEFDIRIDQDYVADFLRACGESFVSIRVLDDSHPVFCESDNGLRSFIMPMSRD